MTSSFLTRVYQTVGDDGYHTPEAVRWAALRACSMGWFEAVVRDTDVGGSTIDKSCVSLEVMLASEKPKVVLTDTTRVEFKAKRRATKGKHRGEFVYEKGGGLNFYVTRSQVKDLMRRYEAATGKCAECFDGQRRNGWSAESGPRYCKCVTCGGSGRAAIAAALGDEPAARGKP